jgi:magnesium transporter
MQFVLFNLSAIVGSAILYGDFKRVSFHQFVTFLYGCAATFAGVFIIAWAPPSSYCAPDSENDDVEHGSVLSSDGRARSGQRDRATLIIPGSMPILRHRASSLSVVGLSPAQVMEISHVIFSVILC